MKSLRKQLATAAIGITAAATFPVLAAAPAAASGCPTVYWGSLPKAASSENPSDALLGVRTGRHECFDRLVFDLASASPATGYRVEYVSQVATVGAGTIVPVRGGAVIRVVATAPAYNFAGQPTWTPANANEIVNVTGYSTLRQIVYLGSFEGQAEFGVGVRARLPMRVFVLPGPGEQQRLVIDIAHHW